MSGPRVDALKELVFRGRGEGDSCLTRRQFCDELLATTGDLPAGTLCLFQVRVGQP